MFDAQKLLGQVLREAAGGGLGGGKRRKHRSGSLTGLPSGLEAKVGMGLLGVAIAAYEHFKQATPAAVQTGANPPPAPLASGLPGASAPSMPPPPPPGRPDLAAPQAAGHADQLRSLHLLRAMVSAANADGQVDATERAQLMQHARDAGLAGEDLDALDREIRNPLSLEQLIVQTPSGLNEEVYIAALIAIDADNPNEHQFLETLGVGLKLDAQAQARLRLQLGIAPPSP